MKSVTRSFLVLLTLLIVAVLTFSAHAAKKKISVARATTAPAPAAPAVAASAGPPRFFNYVSPQGIADSVGDPNIGSNWKTENTPYGSGALFKNKFINGADNPIPNGGTTLFFGGFSPALVRIIFDDELVREKVVKN